MLPKANRLSKNKDISRVFKEGKLVRNDCLSLKFFKNNQNLSENFFFGSRPAPRYFLFFWLPILSDLFRVRLSGDREARFKKRRGKKYFENFKMQPFLQRRDRPCWQLI